MPAAHAQAILPLPDVVLAYLLESRALFPADKRKDARQRGRPVGSRLG
jgi:hypothetical protein